LRWGSRRSSTSTSTPADIPERFDIGFDTAGTLALKTARKLLKPGGTIVDINGTPAKMARSAVSGQFTVLIAQYRADDLEQLARAAAERTREVPVATAVSLDGAIDALTALETGHGPRGGKLVITPNYRRIVSGPNVSDQALQR
jgi:NADPH:quinone reductase-like Zn-dependent oxidoreductase